MPLHVLSPNASTELSLLGSRLAEFCLSCLSEALPRQMPSISGAQVYRISLRAYQGSTARQLAPRGTTCLQCNT